MEKLLPKIDIYHLLVFYYVCNQKSITAAANKLFLSQPTVTAHMKSLERSTQTKLFQIDKKKLTLTHTGEGLYHYAREIFRQSMAADRFIEISKESNLNIGVSSLLVLPVARAINSLSKQMLTSVNFEVRFGESFTLVREVADSNIDVAIVPNFDFGINNLSHFRIADGVKLTFYASAANPIFQKESVVWADLADYPLIIGTEESPMKKILTNKLVAEGLKSSPQFYLTADNFEFFKTIVKNGNSISFSLYEDIHEDVEKGTLKVLPLPSDILVDIDVITHQSHFSTFLVQEFIASVKNAWHKPPKQS
jgi:DNA-binding transcriptional LysR family regulator